MRSRPATHMVFAGRVRSLWCDRRRNWPGVTVRPRQVCRSGSPARMFAVRVH